MGVAETLVNAELKAYTRSRISGEFYRGIEYAKHGFLIQRVECCPDLSGVKQETLRAIPAPSVDDSKLTRELRAVKG